MVIFFQESLVPWEKRCEVANPFSKNPSIHPFNTKPNTTFSSHTQSGQSICFNTCEEDYKWLKHWTRARWECKCNRRVEFQYQGISESQQRIRLQQGTTLFEMWKKFTSCPWDMMMRQNGCFSLTLTQQ